MKLALEHIEQFTRGENIFKTLRIGKRAVIENWFKIWAPDVSYDMNDDLNICVKGSLDFEKGDRLTFLPDNLHVEGWLDLYKSKITSLPNNLHIDEWLDIEETKIISLPNDLHIKGNLYMKKTKITFLPNNLYVKKTIYKDFGFL